MQIRLVTDKKEWDTLADRLDCSYCHCYEWNALSAEFKSLKFEPIGIYDHGVLIDLFPLLLDQRRKSAITCGCLSIEHMDTFFKYAQSTYTLSSMKIASRLPYIRFHQTVYSKYHEMISDISGYADLDSFLKPFHTIRKNHTRALKNGIVVRDSSQAGDFYRFYLEMVKRNNAREVFPLQWFETVLRRMGNRAGITSAYWREKPIGAVFYLLTNSDIYNYFTVIDYQYRELQAGTLLFLAIFNEAFTAGVKRVNLGPDVFGSPTYEFKKRFGAHPIPIYHYQYAGNCLFRTNLHIVNFFRHCILSSPQLYTALRRILRT